MKTLSFVIPVYNEEKRIHRTFKALSSVTLPYGLKLEKVVFVNDGSTDTTFKKIVDFISDHHNANYEIVSYPINKGKGHAIRKGMAQSTSDYTLFFDADISTPLEEIEKIAPYMATGKDVIVGTRKNGKSTVIRHQPLYRELLGRVFTEMTQKALSSNVTDFTCGFKAFSKEANNTIFTKSVIDGWGYDAELIYIAQQNNLDIKEVPVLWSNRDDSKVKIYKAVPRTILDIVKIRQTHKSQTNTWGAQSLAFK